MLFLIVSTILCLMPVAGLIYQWVGSHLDARRYPAPGKMLDVGDHRLHVHLTGAGPATVLLEAGIAASSVSWQPVKSGIGAFARVCAYDRAGLGWSEHSAAPRTIENILKDLQALLAHVSPDAPVVLVGHSFGGLVVLEYARRHREQVAGLVLVDPLPAGEWHPPTAEELNRLRHGVRLARRGALLAKLGVVRLSLDLLQAGSRTVPMWAAKTSGGRGSKLTERLVGEVRKLPRKLWPVVQAHWCQPKSFQSMADHLASLPLSASTCDARSGLGDLPLIVLSASDSSPSRAAEHDRMAARSTFGRKIVAEKSGHWIQLDQPDLVIESVREIISRSSRRSS